MVFLKIKPKAKLKLQKNFVPYLNRLASYGVGYTSSLINVKLWLKTIYIRLITYIETQSQP